MIPKTGKNHAIDSAFHLIKQIFTTRNLSMAFETNSEVKPSSKVPPMLPGLFFQLGK